MGTEPKVEMTEPLEYAPWVTGTTKEAMPTTHLPDDVVATPFMLQLDSRTILDNPRGGGFWVSLQYGERTNPVDLIEYDKEYIIGVLKYALTVLSSGDFTDMEARQEELDADHGDSPGGAQPRE